MKANTRMIVSEIQYMFADKIKNHISETLNEIQKFNELQNDLHVHWCKIYSPVRKNCSCEGIFLEEFNTWKNNINKKLDEMYGFVENDLKYVEKLAKEYQIITGQIKPDEEVKDVKDVSETVEIPVCKENPEIVEIPNFKN